MNHKKPVKILVRVPNWIGDAVISLGFLEALKTQFNPSELTILAHTRVEPIFSHMGERIKFSGMSELFKISLRLREKGFDIGFALPLSFASGFSLFLSGAKKRVGFKKEGRGIFFTDALSLPSGYKRYEHLLKTFFRLLIPFGYEGPPITPKLTLRDEEIEEAHRILRERGLDESRVIAIAPFASFGPSKEWGFNKFVGLIHKVLSRGYSPLILGASWEKNRSEPLCAIQGTHCIIGEYPLRVIAALSKIVKATVANDSGLAHLAASVGGKVVVIFGSTNPKWTSPIGKGVKILYNPPPCGPCFKHRCPLPVHLCMENISVDDVIRALADL